MPSITHSLAEDLLRIQFSTDDDIDESIEVLDCVVVSFDALDKIVAIEVKNASQNTILDGFDGEQPVLVDNSTPAREVYTIGELAAKFRISPRALQKSIQKCDTTDTTSASEAAQPWARERPSCRSPMLNRFASGA